MDEDVFDESKLFSAFDSMGNDDNNESMNSRPKDYTHKSGGLTELDSLKQENLFLKKLLQKISFNPSEVEPFANVLFYNNACSRQGDLEDFIRHIAGGNGENINASKQPLSKRNALSDGFAAALGHISNFEEEKTECETECDISDVPMRCIQYFASFCLDRSGSEERELFPKPPNYERVYYTTLPVESGGKVSQRRKKTCFNCDGDHSLNECTKRRDLARISMKRKEFMESKTYSSDSRYHQDQAKFEQYQHFKPGVISDELRKALNLANHDLPPFIYRMRMLGYPPGWLSGNHDSGIVMYGKEGKEESNKNEQLDSEKFVHYPGFNVPVPAACKDMAREVRLPVMEPRYQLDIKPDNELSENKSNKRKLSSEDEGSHKNKQMKSSTENDMELEDDGPPGTCNVIETYELDSGESQENISSHTQTKDCSHRNEVEDGEIVDSPEGSDVAGQPDWWLKEPLVGHFKKGTGEFQPPPFPLTPLPLHKISQILPGELNHISFEDRSRWLDPIFGNLQVRTGRFEKLKTILAARENKRKSL